MIALALDERSRHSATLERPAQTRLVHSKCEPRINLAKYFGAAVNAYALSYQAATNPATRTPLAITAKDQNRAAAEQIVRQFAGLIRANAGISDEAKEAIGVRPVNNSRSTINVPASSPLLGVIGATPGSHTLRYADSTAPDRMAKPFGAAAIQIFRAVGTEPTTLESAASFTTTSGYFEFRVTRGISASFYCSVDWPIGYHRGSNRELRDWAREKNSKTPPVLKSV